VCDPAHGDRPRDDGRDLANGGKHPVTGEQVVSAETVRQVLSVMTTCGMYNEAGHFWVCEVGFPGKSGVSGCVVGVLPGNLGMATFSPRLDEAGNSVRGMRMSARRRRY
jgi:glutaminase